jgi:hypothetical protein
LKKGGDKRYGGTDISMGKKVLDHIATQAKGGIWEETRGEVAKALGCSESTVKRALHELKRAGYLEVIAPGGGRGKPTRYRVKPVKEEPVPGPESKTGPSQDSRAPGPKTPAAEPVQLEPVLARASQKDPLISALVDGIKGLKELGHTVIETFEQPAKHPILYKSLWTLGGGTLGFGLGYTVTEILEHFQGPIPGERKALLIGASCLLGARWGLNHARRRLAASQSQPKLSPPTVKPYPQGDVVEHIVHSLVLSGASMQASPSR